MIYDRGFLVHFVRKFETTSNKQNLVVVEKKIRGIAEMATFIRS